MITVEWGFDSQIKKSIISLFTFFEGIFWKLLLYNWKYLSYLLIIFLDNTKAFNKTKLPFDIINSS